MPEEPARALGRCGELLDFVVAARLLVGARGRVCFVYPARELVTLVEGLRAAGLEPKRLKAVHARQQLAARVVLIEAQPAKRGGLEVLAPQIDQSPLEG